MLELVLLFVVLAALGWSAWLDTLWIAGVAVVLYLAGNWLFGDLSHLAFLADPVTLAAIVVVSLTIGTLWSLWKWRRHMLSPAIQNVLGEAKAEYDRMEGRDGSENKPPFRESAFFPRNALPSNNVERIVTWIMLWPFSMLVYFFEDFLVDIGRWIYNRLGRVYSRITDAAIPKD